MDSIRMFPAGSTSACRFGAASLEKAGVTLVDHPSPELTHLLLDVPSFTGNGVLRGGGDLERLLRMLPPDITVVGGNLTHPALAGYTAMDLMKDAQYLAANAAITADCALRVAAPLLTTAFADSPTLIIGWGRIGKCLGQLLKAIGADVTVAARKETDRAMLRALGFHAADTANLAGNLSRFRLIFNTVPQMLLSETQLASCGQCVKIDLASRPGMGGDDVIRANGLPGVRAPESSGKLIAETVLRRLREETT